MSPLDATFCSRHENPRLSLSSVPSLRFVLDATCPRALNRTLDATPALVSHAFVAAVAARDSAATARLLRKRATPPDEAVEALLDGDGAAWAEFVADAACAAPTDLLVAAVPALRAPAVVAAVAARQPATVGRLLAHGALSGAREREAARRALLVADAKLWREFSRDEACAAVGVPAVLKALPELAAQGLIGACFARRAPQACVCETATSV